MIYLVDLVENIGWQFQVSSNWGGWTRLSDGLTPIPTDRDVAPGNIWKIIRWKCKNTAKNQYATNICTWQKNGLECMSACGECHEY